ncbi:ParB/RepB/Spo0J family partition protein [Methyloceanibacter stevinii]|nr:ParB/RepB/Spo0J family partition protein [Methyloceanibacter stevinii]
MTNKSNETAIQHIPLAKLTPWDGNVRRTGASEGIDELAASIKAHGLLQSLVVRKGKRGKYEVVAGRRRYLALKALLKSGAIGKDYPVACRLADEELDATELSLAENIVRLAMHPADQFEAFRDLMDGGSAIADIAARFGVSEKLVAQRLRLGRVSPVILDAYRKGEINLELVQAFAISDDHAAQERIWSELPDWERYPRTVKRLLTEDEIPSSDKRVRLVGLDTYIELGGPVRRDLFEAEDSGYVLDPELLDRLVLDKLRIAASAVTEEGWRWVEIVSELDYGRLATFERRYAEPAELSDEDQAELDALTAEYDGIVDTDDEDQIERLDAIDSRIDDLTAKALRWTDDVLELAGAIVSVGHGGDIRIERGLVRPEDAPAEDAGSSDVDHDADEPAVKLSARLVEDLSARKSAAISAELAKRPDVALVVVVHALALGSFYTYARGHSCLELSASVPAIGQSLYDADGCIDLNELETVRESWLAKLPQNPGGLWGWCLEQSHEVLLQILAVIAARSIDAVQSKGMAEGASELLHASAVAEALGIEMAGHFTPTADNFFGRISGKAIGAAIAEAKAVTLAPGWSKMKKAELAALAEREIAGSGWLPKPIRLSNSDDLDHGDESPNLKAAC